MRNALLVAGPALALCGAVALTPVAFASTPGPGGSPSLTHSSSPAPVVGAARISVNPSEARTGQTVQISGSCAPYPGATVKSVASQAGEVTLTDHDPQHIRGRLHITAGAGTYQVNLVCSNGKAATTLKVDAAPAHHRHGGGASAGDNTPATTPSQHQGTVPKGAPRTGESGTSELNEDVALAGVGAAGAAAMAGAILVTARRNREHDSR
ncbi:hypothetical protein AB0H73_05415 [Streptomyces olivoreticuli]|uniref:hypothetical protein n=1 Tax=Streptomyces olivoreticuli TaxID=68246 RepID=UPI000E286CF7|nr:hypothetical protein [Streptomyces olivoreticuli]